MQRIFSPEALREASAAELSPQLFAARKPVEGITIDGPTSRDLDDAIWVEKTNPGYKISVSIADISALVAKGSALDKAAFERGFTLYRAWGNSPMLPAVLSEDRLSLLEGKLRPTITATIELNDALEIVSTHLAKTALTSSKRYSYDEATSDIRTTGHRMYMWGHLAEQLMEKRRQQGALVFYDLKTGLYVGAEGRARLLSQNTAHAQILVQEMMILANRAVAEKMAKDGIAFFFRNHGAATDAAERGKIIHSLADLMRSSGPDISQVNRRFKLFFQRARYGSASTGHIGLSLGSYTHFTSPIRRYADLIGHRVITATIDAAPPPYSKAELDAFAAHVNKLVDAERDQMRDKERADTLKRATTQTISATEHTISQMHAEEFAALIRHVAESARITDAMAKGIRARIKKGALTPNDLYQIIMVAPADDTLWQAIKSEVIGYLEKNPQHAVSVLSAARQNAKILQDYTIESDRVGGQDHMPIFGASVTVIIGAERFTTKQTVVANAKTEAEQNAALLLLKNYVSGTLVAPEEAVKLAPAIVSTHVTYRNAGGVSQQNAFSVLNELSQQHGFKVTDNSTQSGPSHAPHFTFVLTLSGGDLSESVSVSAEGRVKQDAKTAAAQKALEHAVIRSLSVSKAPVKQPMGEVSAHTAAKNPVSTLMELAQANGWAVTENYAKSGPDHMPDITAELTITGSSLLQPVKVTATARSKQVAKVSAAEAAMQHTTIAGFIPEHIPAGSRSSSFPLPARLPAEKKTDYVSQLNTRKQKGQWGKPAYTIATFEGEGKPAFQASITIAGQHIGTIQARGLPGANKAEAEQKAALAALCVIDINSILAKLNDRESGTLRQTLEKAKEALIEGNGAMAIQASARVIQEKLAQLTTKAPMESISLGKLLLAFTPSIGPAAERQQGS